jgi:cytochrome oxidase Cu insertion factor (SCO1/SenC/PrrC family)
MMLFQTVFRLAAKSWLALVLDTFSLFTLCFSTSALAEPHAHHQSAPLSAMGKDEPILNLSIPDVDVYNQDGQRLRFYQDLVKDRVVAINFIFTSCHTICPPLAATFANVQKLLDEQTRKELTLISISVDPVTDTPERLKAWAAKFEAKPGWTLVTGAKPDLDQLLKALNASSARREDHTPIVLLGNDTTGSWTRTYGLTPPKRLISILERLLGHSATAQLSGGQS